MAGKTKNYMNASQTTVLQDTRKVSETCVVAIVKIIAHLAKRIKSEHSGMFKYFVKSLALNDY